MNHLYRFFSRFILAKKTSRPSRPRHRLELGLLEDRTVPAAFSSITGNINGLATTAGNTLWFNSAFKASNLPASPVTLQVTDQRVTFSAGGTNYSINVPDSIITLSPSITTATTKFDTAANRWVTNLPSSFRGDAFLGGAAFHLDATLPRGIKAVTWGGNFTSDTPGVTLKWHWSAAAYTSFSSDYNALNVKPLDGSGSITVYRNSDNAGTPEAFKPFAVGGACGGGRSHFTGPHGASKKVTPEFVAATASVSGRAYWDANGDGVFDIGDYTLPGVTVTLVSNGTVVAQTTTDSEGNYSFGNLAAGVYTISETQPDNYVQGTNNLGSLGGSVSLDSFTVTLSAGDAGSGYNFGEVLSNPNS